MRVLLDPFSGRVVRFALAVASGAAVSGCGARTGGDPTPPLGTWIAHNGYAIEQIVLTFSPDETFTLSEDIGHTSGPAVSPIPTGCTWEESYFGTYAVATHGDTNLLSWTFKGGSGVAQIDCANAADDSAGQAMTTADIARGQSDGSIPPATCSYTMTPTTLTLAWAVYQSGSGSVTFTKAR